jgi:hypothetical protein
MNFKYLNLIKLNCKIIYWNVVHFAGYCIINCHCMHGNEYHKIFTIHNIGVKLARPVKTTIASWTPNFHCRAHKSSPSAAVLSKLNRVHTLALCYLLCPAVSSDLLLSASPTKRLNAFSSTPCVLPTRPSTLSSIDYPNFI